ncbi:MAG: type II toxin-antitoxin system RelE/ParE family toxin [Candidatus Edwardsbacteria bacterium]|nr:type II toxin-antitoxin system RelE/ParE family toxin [Candidatus Edwardsbacteria bacterium]
MLVIFSRYAKQELEDAVHYYELEYSGLGKRFKEEVRRTTLRIAEYPQAWSIERGDIRKCLLHKFPYKLLYSMEGNYILVIAVAHQHRKPDYWIDRNET